MIANTELDTIFDIVIRLIKSNIFHKEDETEIIPTLYSQIKTPLDLCEILSIHEKPHTNTGKYPWQTYFWFPNMVSKSLFCHLCLYILIYAKTSPIPHKNYYKKC